MTLLLLLVRVSIVLAVAFGAAHVLRRRSAALRADLWRATFVALALLPVATVCLPALRLLPSLTGLDPTPSVPAGVRQDQLPPLSAAGFAEGATLAAALDRAAIEPLAGKHPAGDASPVVPATGEGRAVLAPIVDALVVLWFIGALALLTRLFLGLRRASSIAGNARERVDVDVPASVAVVTSGAASGPFVWDPRPFGRATVVLPDGASDTGIWGRAVLAHELHHIERRDGLFLAFATAVAAAFWPAPLARRALGRLRLEAERAADDAVLRAGVRASDYAAGLVALAAGPSALPVPGMAASNTVTRRVESLLEGDVDRTATGPLARIAAAGAALSVCVPIATLAAAHAQEAETAVETRARMRERALDALVAMHDARTGAWHGDVGFKLNNDWRVTAENVPHVGVTGLAVEALVLAGQQPDGTPRGRALSAGIDFLLEHQNGHGYFTSNGTRMRSHAYATRALATAIAADIDKKVLVAALEESIPFVLEAQSDLTGGWRFVPGAEDTDIIETAYQVDASYCTVRSLARASAAAAARIPGGVKEMNRRAWQYAASAKIDDPEDRSFGAFRYQPQENARVTWNTTAAGALLMGAENYDDLDVWKTRMRRLKELRASRAGALEHSEGHFLTWDAELLTERYLDALGEARAPAMMEPSAEWRADTEAWLSTHRLPTGGWKCAVGTGDAFVTAIGCILLAEND